MCTMNTDQFILSNSTKISVREHSFIWSHHYFYSRREIDVQLWQTVGNNLHSEFDCDLVSSFYGIEFVHL